MEPKTVTVGYRFTVSLYGEVVVLLLKLVVALVKLALIACRPGVSVVMDRDAVLLVAPAISVTCPRVVFVVVSVKITEPLGRPAPGATAVTVAMKVTDVPTFDGLGLEEVITVVVEAELTV